MKRLGPVWVQGWREKWTVGGLFAVVLPRVRYVIEIRREKRQ